MVVDEMDEEFERERGRSCFRNEVKEEREFGWVELLMEPLELVF